MSNVRTTNKSFARLIRNIRKVMPILATVLLVSVYVVSAIAGGMFLSSLMGAMAGGALVAYAIASATQATRATLVFFSQLNPSRPSFSLWGEIIAVLMGAISIYEILSLVNASGLPQPVAISLSILMAAGVGVELFLLREIKFATSLELFSNREQWADLKEFYRGKREFKKFLDGLKDNDESEAQATQPSSSIAPEQGRLTEETKRQIEEAQDLVTGQNLHRVKVEPDHEAEAHYEAKRKAMSGNGLSPSLNGQH